MKILYFAWVKTRVGAGEECVDPPTSVATVRDLAAWLAERSPGHAQALGNLALLRAAVNQDFAAWESRVGPDDEVAFFPPVTGG